MPGPAGRLIIQTSSHPTYRWLLVPVNIGSSLDVEMVLDTGSPVSAISEHVRDDLANSGLLRPSGPKTYRLRELKIQGQQIPDLDVRVLRRLTMLGLDGLLALDFLVQFTDIHFHVPTLRLTLTDP